MPVCLGQKSLDLVSYYPSKLVKIIIAAINQEDVLFVCLLKAPQQFSCKKVCRNKFTLRFLSTKIKERPFRVLIVTKLRVARFSAATQDCYRAFSGTGSGLKKKK